MASFIIHRQEILQIKITFLAVRVATNHLTLTTVTEQIIDQTVRKPPKAEDHWKRPWISWKFETLLSKFKKKKKVAVIDNLTNYSGTLAEIISLITLFHSES